MKLRRMPTINGIACVALAYVVLMHIFLSTNTLDDIYFTQVFRQYQGDVFQYMTDRYIRWSSRIFIDLAAFYVGALPEIVWKILNIAMICLLYKQIAWLMQNILKAPNTASPIIMLAMCIYPFSNMGSTGWLATTVNYLWVLASGMYAINKILKIAYYDDLRLSSREIIFSSICILYACSHEAMAAIMLLTVIFVLIFKKRDKCIFVFGILILIILGIIFASPGNYHRLQNAFGIPEYYELPIFQKFRIGVATTFLTFVSIPNMIFFLFNLVLACGGGGI